MTDTLQHLRDALAICTDPFTRSDLTAAITEIETLRAELQHKQKLQTLGALAEINNVLYRYRNENRTDAVNELTAKEIWHALTQLGLS